MDIRRHHVLLIRSGKILTPQDLGRRSRGAARLLRRWRAEGRYATALHTALARHPALYMSTVKEPKFFLTDGPPPAQGGPGDAKTYREHVWRRPDYEALFDPASAGQLRGESTPFYLYNEAAQRRIRAQVPGAKLIVVLRDPVERAHSNWTHLWLVGLDPVDDFVQACAEEERRIEAGWAEFWHYTALGRYGEQLPALVQPVPARHRSWCSATDR